MSKTHVYGLGLVPEDGPTLMKRTREEWELGYRFVVLWSDSPMFRKGNKVSKADIDAQEEHHPVRFMPEFKALSVEDYFHEQTAHDHGFAVALEGLTT